LTIKPKFREVLMSIKFALNEFSGGAIPHVIDSIQKENYTIMTTSTDYF